MKIILLSNKLVALAMLFAAVFAVIYYYANRAEKEVAKRQSFKRASAVYKTSAVIALCATIMMTTLLVVAIYMNKIGG